MWVACSFSDIQSYSYYISRLKDLKQSEIIVIIFVEADDIFNQITLSCIFYPVFFSCKLPIYIWFKTNHLDQCPLLTQRFPMTENCLQNSLVFLRGKLRGGSIYTSVNDVLPSWVLHRQFDKDCSQNLAKIGLTALFFTELFSSQDLSPVLSCFFFLQILQFVKHLIQ